jgi:hypothetical protein
MLSYPMVPEWVEDFMHCVSSMLLHFFTLDNPLISPKQYNQRPHSLVMPLKNI